jgi:type I restriction enzyme M protein
MLDNETKRRIDTARNILVGRVPDPKSQVEQITIALIYKFMDDMDAQAVEYGGDPSFFVGEYDKYSWRKLFAPSLSGYERMALYGEGIEKAKHNEYLPPLFLNIFKNASLPFREPETLTLFLKTINEFKYDHSEMLGDAFEYLLSCLQSQGDSGMFRTPRHIIDFIVEVLEPKKNETICDPACGTAGFLISSYKHILNNNQRTTPGDLLTPDERKQMMTNFAGYDISPDMVRLSLVNLYLHGFPNPSVIEYDTLTSEDRWNETFDIILANPPFMSPKGGIKPHKKFSISANRSEVLFVDYIAEHIHPTHGRAGIIVPEGIIFQSATAYKDLRKILVDKQYLYAVVSLPAGVFNPYSGVKTSILLMDRTLAQKTDKILFVKIANDGFGLGAQRKELATSNLPDALNVIRDFGQAILQGDTSRFEIEDANLQAVAIEKTKIAENGDYNLSGDRYINAKIHSSTFEIVSLGDVSNRITKGTTPTSMGFDFLEDGINFVKIESIKSDGKFIKEKFAKISQECNQALSRSMLKENDILFSIAGAFGRVGIVDKSILPANTNQALSIISLKDNVNPNYLFHLLKADQIKQEIDRIKTGVAQYNLSLGQVSDLKIPLPPLSIQKEIVEKIEGFQRIIDGAKQVVENYKPQIDTSPDWEMVELGEIGELKNGINYTKESEAEFIQVLGVKDFKSNFYAPLDSFATIQLDGKINDDYLLKENDIVFVRSNGNPDLIGRSVVIPKLDFNATFSGFTIRLRISSTKVFPLFYAHLLKTDSVRKMLTDSGTGANIRSLNQTSLKELTLPIPPLEFQKEIVARIEREQELVNANQELIKIFGQRIKDEIGKLWEV